MHIFPTFRKSSACVYIHKHTHTRVYTFLFLPSLFSHSPYLFPLLLCLLLLNKSVVIMPRERRLCSVFSPLLNFTPWWSLLSLSFPPLAYHQGSINSDYALLLFILSSQTRSPPRTNPHLCKRQQFWVFLLGTAS